MTENMNVAVQAIRNFVYFTRNYPTPKDMCEDIWGKGVDGNHFYSKLSGYDFDMCRFFLELSLDNQTKFAEWIIKNYDCGWNKGKYHENPQNEERDFVDYCKSHIADKIRDFVSRRQYCGADFAYELTQEENVNGTLTFSRDAAVSQLCKWWYDCAEYWKYEADNFGEHGHNPFDEPEAYMVCMVVEGCASLLGQTDALQEVWNEGFDLTDELADKIIEQVNNINEIW